MRPRRELVRRLGRHHGNPTHRRRRPRSPAAKVGRKNSHVTVRHSNRRLERRIATASARESLLISKAGGATVQEAIPAGCPMIVNHIIPGQEEGNARYLVETNSGTVATTHEEVIARGAIGLRE